MYSTYEDVRVRTLDPCSNKVYTAALWDAIRIRIDTRLVINLRINVVMALKGIQR